MAAVTQAVAAIQRGTAPFSRPSCARRTVVSLTTQAVAALREHLRTNDLARDGDAFVFSSDADGARPWRPDLVTRRWERLRKKAHVAERIRIHDLRHFVATELLGAGIDARTVANRLGHARTSTTLDIYWAWVPARDRDAAAHLGGLLGVDPSDGARP